MSSVNVNQKQQYQNPSGHELNCACDECAGNIKRLFQAFFVDTTPYEKALPCPECRRPVRHTKRSQWYVYGCWCYAWEQAMITVVRDDPMKMFGFAEAPNKNIFFHFNQFKHVVFTGGDWLELRPIVDGQVIIPEVEACIIYQEITGPKGPKALWWSFFDEYQRAKAELDNRPLYRFVERQGREAMSRLHEKPKRRIYWEGKNLVELRYRFSMLSSPVYDIGHRAMYFECFDVALDEWVRCDDPR